MRSLLRIKRNLFAIVKTFGLVMVVLALVHSVSAQDEEAPPLEDELTLEEELLAPGEGDELADDLAEDIPPPPEEGLADEVPAAPEEELTELPPGEPVPAEGDPQKEPVQAQEEPPAEGLQASGVSTNYSRLSKLPPIEAKTFPVDVDRASRSKRVYLLKDISQRAPTVGRIILLRQKSNNVMAFRVLKNYNDQDKFAAKRVRLYNNIDELPAGERYIAIEKISDILSQAPISPVERAKDDADLEELEQDMPKGTDPTPVEGETEDAVEVDTRPLPKVVAYDEELDAGISPPPRNEPTRDKEDEERLRNLVAREFPILDRDNSWITTQFGFFRNNLNVQGDVAYYTGFGFRYGYAVSRNVFVNTRTTQDSLLLEGGVFMYKVLGFESTNDTYTVAPLIFATRYNLHVTSGMAVFFYAGLVKNFVAATTEGTDNGIASLGSVLPAAGTGLIFQMGPKWNLRVDLGLDMLGTGLVLRF